MICECGRGEKMSTGKRSANSGCHECMHADKYKLSIRKCRKCRKLLTEDRYFTHPGCSFSEGLRKRYSGDEYGSQNFNVRTAGRLR